MNTISSKNEENCHTILLFNIICHIYEVITKIIPVTVKTII